MMFIAGTVGQSLTGVKMSFESKIICLEQRCQELASEVLRLQSSKIPDEAFDRERFEWEDIKTQKRFNDALDRIQKMRRISVVKTVIDQKTRVEFYLCGSCGKSIGRNYKYCQHCGTNLLHADA